MNLQQVYYTKLGQNNMNNLHDIKQNSYSSQILEKNIIIYCKENRDISRHFIVLSIMQ